MTVSTSTVTAAGMASEAVSAGGSGDSGAQAVKIHNTNRAPAGRANRLNILFIAQTLFLALSDNARDYFSTPVTTTP